MERTPSSISKFSLSFDYCFQEKQKVERINACWIDRYKFYYNNNDKILGCQTSIICVFYQGKIIDLRVQ